MSTSTQIKNIKKHLNQSIINIVEYEARQLIGKISSDYELNERELLAKYLFDTIDVSNVTDKCMARITKNRQCSKRRYKKSDFCKLHNVKKNLKNGRIDEDLPQKKNPKVNDEMIKMASNEDTVKLIAEEITLEDGTECFQCDLNIYDKNLENIIGVIRDNKFVPIVVES
jgi:hypothetical protein